MCVARGLSAPGAALIHLLGKWSGGHGLAREFTQRDAKFRDMSQGFNKGDNDTNLRQQPAA